jgi:hypothetical protein
MSPQRSEPIVLCLCGGGRFRSVDGITRRRRMRRPDRRRSVIPDAGAPVRIVLTARYHERAVN